MAISSLAVSLASLPKSRSRDSRSLGRAAFDLSTQSKMNGHELVETLVRAADHASVGSNAATLQTARLFSLPMTKDRNVVSAKPPRLA